MRLLLVLKVSNTANATSAAKPSPQEILYVMNVLRKKNKSVINNHFYLFIFNRIDFMVVQCDVPW